MLSSASRMTRPCSSETFLSEEYRRLTRRVKNLGYWLRLARAERLRVKDRLKKARKRAAAGAIPRFSREEAIVAALYRGRHYDEVWSTIERLDR